MGWKFSRRRQSLRCRSWELDGRRSIAVAELENDCDCVINFSIDINSGKAALVLVEPSSNVKVLKKVTAQSGDGYNGNIEMYGPKRRNVIKIVEEDYSGSFKVSQQDGLFKYDDAVEGMREGVHQNMNENFSVGSKANT